MNRTYTLARLKRDRPDLAERVAVRQQFPAQPIHDPSRCLQRGGACSGVSAHGTPPAARGHRARPVSSTRWLGQGFATRGLKLFFQPAVCALHQQPSCSSIDEVQLCAGQTNHSLKLIFGRVVINRQQKSSTRSRRCCADARVRPPSQRACSRMAKAAKWDRQSNPLRDHATADARIAR